MPLKDSYKRKFASELYNIKEIHSEIMDFLRSRIITLSPDDEFDLKLIFNELLVNAVKHGNSQDKGKFVSVTISVLSGDTIYAEIVDEGHGFDYIKLLGDITTDEGLFSEHGRGIRLVYSLADSVSFNVTGNVIKFYKKVSLYGKNTCC